MSLIVFLVSVALYLFYKWATATYDFFEKQGVPFNRPLPLLGSEFGVLLKKQPFVASLTNNYNKYKNDK
jgi:hypothetical protein